MEEIENGIASFLIGSEELSLLATKLLPNLSEDELLTDGFDDEQIFQQIEALYTTPTITNAEEFDELEIESDDEEIQENLENENSEQSDENDEEIDDREDDLDLEGEPDEATFEDEMMAEKALRDDFQKFEKTEIDDDFFSLREMEKFCDEEDEKEMNDEMDEDLDEELQDELYGEGALEDEDEDDEKEIMHDDFFKSRFEKRKEKIAEELEALEDEAVREKSWHLLGETTAKTRENDQLLAMDLDFDAVGSAQAPTVEATETLEAIIIQRIRDKAFDDVERKSRELIEPAEAKRKIIPDEERKSLSQLYEDEFLQSGKDLDEDKDRKLIKDDMSKLFAQLDFLTYDTVVNQKEVEVKVLSDAPALNSEERGLSLLSTFNSLAPEEVAGKSRGSLIDKAERSATDIKRDRRKVKAKIKARKAAGKEITFKKPKKKPEADLRPVDGNKVKWTNSTKVFKALQDEVDHGTLSAIAKKKMRKNQILEQRKAKSFKL